MTVLHARIKQCPKCGKLLHPIPIGARTGTAFGGVAGIGLAIHLYNQTKDDFGPIPASICAALGALISLVLSGFFTGSLAGFRIGRHFDRFVLKIWKCPHCGKVVFLP